MRGFQRTLLSLAALLTAQAAAAQDVSPEHAEETIRQVQESHIAANVPPKEDFDRFLKRDLAAYLRSSEQHDVQIEYELLRNGPTQSGIAYPKYYVWVRALERGALIRQGAARVAAIERNRFEVTHFLERAEIQKDRSQLQMLFPPPVVSLIEARLDSPIP
jgi:hypothetical protein